MPDYTPFPVGNFTEGMFKARESWLTPAGAWRKLDNAYILRGRVRKRGGSKLFAPLYTKAWGEEEFTGTNPFSGQLGLGTGSPPAGQVKRDITHPVQPGSVVLTDSSGSPQIVTDNGLNILKQGGTNVGIINYDTGQFLLNFLSAPTGPVKAEYNFRRTTIGGSNNPVMGIFNFNPLSGASYLIAFDTRRMFIYDSINHVFDDKSEEDTWTGDADNLFQVADVNGMLAIANAKDPLYRFDPVGDDISEIPTDWDTPGTSGITNPHMIFFHKQRLIVIRASIDGEAAPRTAIWTKVNPVLNDVNDWESGLNLANASCTCWAQTGIFVQDDIICGFDSSFHKLQWTDDFRQAFTFVRLTREYGALGRMIPVSVHDAGLFISNDKMLLCDGQRVYRLDDNVPDEMLNWDPNMFSRAFGLRVDVLRQAIFSYVPAGESTPKSAFVYQFEDKAFSMYDWPYTCFGTYKVEVSKLWDDYSEDWDDVPVESFDSPDGIGGYPILLGGTVDSQVYQLFTGLLDSGQPIVTIIRTGRLSFHPNMRSRLGYVDIFAERADGENLIIKFYRGNEGPAYLTKSINLTGTGSEDKVRRRILVNTTSDFHSIEIEHSGGGVFNLDGIVFWASPEGEIRST